MVSFDSFDFLWFPSVSFGLGLGGFYGFLWFPSVSFGLICFPLVSKGETKEKKIQGKNKPIKDTLRRLKTDRMHQSCLLLRRLLELEFSCFQSVTELPILYTRTNLQQ